MRNSNTLKVLIFTRDTSNNPGKLIFPAPTILAEAGIAKPKEVPSVWFVPILTGEKPNGNRDEIFHEWYWESDFPMTPTMFGMRMDNLSIYVITVFGTGTNSTILRTTLMKCIILMVIPKNRTLSRTC